MSYAPGNFSFLPAAEVALYKNAYDAVTTEGLWDFFHDQSPPPNKGYMFWDAPELKKLAPHLEPMGHSGSSYGFTMRTMEAIAKKGWAAFVETYKKTEEQQEEELLSPGPPLPLMRCPPRGVDPYAEERKEARAAAAAGALCPANQHGCLYFPRSEWRFCPMCEWQTGAAEGRFNGTLGKLSVAKTTFAEESAAGQDIALSYEEANQLLKDYKAFVQGGINPVIWAIYGPESVGRCYFTRSEIHNLFMEHGCPMDALNDESWVAIKDRFQ